MHCELIILFDSQMSHLRPVKAPSNCLLCPFDEAPLVFECLFTLAQDAPSSSGTFPASDWNQPYLQGTLVPFSQDLVEQRADSFIYALYVGIWVRIHLKIKKNC